MMKTVTSEDSDKSSDEVSEATSHSESQDTSSIKSWISKGTMKQSGSSPDLPKLEITPHEDEPAGDAKPGHPLPLSKTHARTKTEMSLSTPAPLHTDRSSSTEERDEIKATSFEGLIDALTASIVAPDLVFQVLLTYRSICKPLELLEVYLHSYLTTISDILLRPSSPRSRP